jgi:hypothetical protein
LSFFIFVIGHFSSDLRALSNSVASVPARWLFRVLYYLLPNFSNFSTITATAHGVNPSARTVVGAMVYGVLYVAALLSVAALVFRRRNFK